jgi:hypothetical protein
MAPRQKRDLEAKNVDLARRLVDGFCGRRFQ